MTHLNEKKNDPDLKELLTTEKRLEEVKGKLKKEEELLTELKLLSNSQTKNIEDLNKEIKTLKQDLENIGKIEQNILKYQKEIDQYVLENDKYKENTNKLELTEDSNGFGRFYLHSTSAPLNIKDFTDKLTIYFINKNDNN